MATPAYYPYRSEAARERCVAFLDATAARDWPVRSEERMVPTGWGDTFVRLSGPGDGPPLVLLHGAAATSLMWAPNIRELSETCRTIAVDQIGEFGRSRCTRPVQSLGDLMQWLDDLFDGLGLAGGINLAGISYGGALTAQYALHAPGRLSRAILLAPGNTVLRLSTGFILRMVLAQFSMRRFLPGMMRWTLADIARKDPQWMEATLDQIFLAMEQLQRRKIVIPPVMRDAEWAGLAVPTMFVVGEQEVIYSARKAVRRLQRVAPQVRVEVVPRAGHGLTFSQVEMVNRLMIEFVGQERGAARGAPA